MSAQALVHAQALEEQRATLRAPGPLMEGIRPASPQGLLLPSPELPPGSGERMPSAKQPERSTAHAPPRPVTQPQLQHWGEAAGAPADEHLSKLRLER